MSTSRSAFSAASSRDPRYAGSNSGHPSPSHQGGQTGYGQTSPSPTRGGYRDAPSPSNNRPLSGYDPRSSQLGAPSNGAGGGGSRPTSAMSRGTDSHGGSGASGRPERGHGHSHSQSQPQSSYAGGGGGGGNGHSHSQSSGNGNTNSGRPRKGSMGMTLGRNERGEPDRRRDPDLIEFCNEFWVSAPPMFWCDSRSLALLFRSQGQGDVGYDSLMNRIRSSAKTMEELRSFYKER